MHEDANPLEERELTDIQAGDLLIELYDSRVPRKFTLHVERPNKYKTPKVEFAGGNEVKHKVFALLEESTGLDIHVKKSILGGGKQFQFEDRKPEIEGTIN